MEHYQKIDIVELYGYLNEINCGYIRANYHPEDDNIVILNYTELATFEKRWNKYTMSARGLILDLTNVKDNGIIYIIAKPFQKFPNYGSNEIEGYEDDINWNEVEVVMDKMDGSLGISYIFKGEVRFATRGSFNSEQALRATKIWHTKYIEANKKYMAHLEAFPAHNPTMLVEIIYPENRVVVDYKSREELVLLGITKMNHDFSYDSVLQFGDYLDLPVTHKRFLNLEDMLSLKKIISANDEGWIVRFKNGKRLKIKGEEYIKVHKIMHGMSDKAKVEAWKDQRMNDYILSLPEEFRPELEKLTDELDKLKDSLYILFETFFEMINEKATDQKSFALLVNDVVDKEYRKFMFEARKKGSIPVDLIRKHVYEHYIEYLEVIKWKN